MSSYEYLLTSLSQERIKEVLSKSVFNERKKLKTDVFIRRNIWMN